MTNIFPYIINLFLLRISSGQLELFLYLVKMLIDDIYVTKEFMIQIFRFSYVKSIKESDLSSNSFPDTSWLVSPYDLNEQVV